MTSTSPRKNVDLLVYNGKIATMDSNSYIAQAFVVQGNRIIAVGGDDLRQQYQAVREVDLGGRFVIPGFIDTHTHMSGNAPWHLDLTKVTSITELQQLIAERIKVLPPGHWITGYGWSEDSLVEGRRPLRADLDQVALNNPVGLTRAGGHSAVFNSVALALGPIHESTDQPENGVIEKDEQGKLNGIIRERQDLLLTQAPKAKDEDVRESFVTNLRGLFALGITSFVQAADNIDHYAEWQHIYRQHAGTLPRATVQVRWEGENTMQAFRHRIAAADNPSPDHLQLGAIKIFSDGGFTGPAAFTRRPYRGMGDYRGSLTTSAQALQQTIEEVHRNGWQLGIHAIGDAAIELVVADLEQALQRYPRPNHRHYLNHFTIKPSDVTMARMAKNNIAITQQPNFTWTLEGRYLTYLEPDALESNNPMRSPMNHGIFVALSSDILPLGPIVGLHAAVTRKGMSGKVYGREEALTIEEALRGYTRNGAYLIFAEADRGTIEAGKLADFVVLSEDPLLMNLLMHPARLLELKVEATYLGGQLVWPNELGR